MGRCLFSGIAFILFALQGANIFARDVTFLTGSYAFTLKFTDIGNPGNLPDSSHPYFKNTVPYGNITPGAVEYNYSVTTYEISRDTITKANTFGNLYITLADMTSYTGNGTIKPATGISWYEAARFVNLLNTSTGNSPAYKFVTGTTTQALWVQGEAGYDSNNPFRNKRAKYVIPNENEWYKAAYYNPADGSYNEYATGDFIPVSFKSANTYGSAIWTKNMNPDGPADINMAGGLSPYGTMGQSGNVHEWLEGALDGGNNDTTEQRQSRGGSWATTTSLGLSGRYGPGGLSPANEQVGIGFRVAMITGSEFSYILNKTCDANRGSITLSADSSSYYSGSVITASASPKTGYLFSSWTGSVSTSATNIEITMNSDKNITANFVEDANDTDGDGLTNYQESVVFGTNPNVSETTSPVSGLYLKSQYNSNKDAGKMEVIAQPSLYGLYNATQMQAMAFDDLVLTKNANGSFTLNYDIEQSTDLQTWTPYQALSLPLTGLPTDKAFVRIKAKQ